MIQINGSKPRATMHQGVVVPRGGAIEWQDAPAYGVVEATFVREPKAAEGFLAGTGSNTGIIVGGSRSEEGPDYFGLGVQVGPECSCDPVEASRHPVHVANAQLPVLPEPLGLRHGPLLVTLQWWDKGVVKADLPCCALFGEGETDTAALEDLGETMLDWARGIVELGGREKLGGALLRQWDMFVALVDVARL
jgi:hypothetical protein